MTPAKTFPDKASYKEFQTKLARNSLSAFLWATLPTYKMGWVHEEICCALDRFLQAVIRQESPRLMITMPPRHGKTELASRRFPAYVLGRYPDMNIIATSYSASLASRNNRDVQRIMDDPLYQEIFPETRLWGKNTRIESPTSYIRNSDMFEVVGHKGSYRSAGVGGGITGMGGDIILIDDPFKDRAEADSQTIREKVWDWYTSTLYTRLAPGGGIIVINTRWHMDDLSGRLLEAQTRGDGDNWEIINFPAIAESDDEHRKVGEALHPERYSLDQLLKIKAAVGSRDWEALYQQHPVPDGGAIFKEEWLSHRWIRLPEIQQSIISWDMSFKEGNTKDFVVGQVWGRCGSDLYLIDQVRGRWGFTDTLQQFKNLYVKYPNVNKILVEDKANGPAVIDTLKHEIGRIIPIEPDGSKEARAHAVTALFESGNVYLPADGIFPWVKEYVSELLQFPSGAHDDQVDATTQAIRDLEQHKPLAFSQDTVNRLRRRR